LYPAVTNFNGRLVRALLLGIIFHQLSFNSEKVDTNAELQIQLSHMMAFIFAASHQKQKRLTGNQQAFFYHETERPIY
jgi:hypothetical protein